MATVKAIVCGGLPDDRLPVRDRCPVRLCRFGERPNVHFRVERVRWGLARELPPVLLDLLDVAADE